MEEVELEFLLACALHRDTWLTWVPKEIIEKIPHDTKVTISCLPDKVWVIMNQEYNVLWSTIPITPIGTTNLGAQQLRLLIALLTNSEEPPPLIA